MNLQKKLLGKSDQFGNLKIVIVWGDFANPKNV